MKISWDNAFTPRTLTTDLLWWLTCVDSTSPRSRVEDTLWPALWFSGGWSSWTDHAEILSLWRHGQRCQPHGVNWKTYVHVMMTWLSSYCLTSRLGGLRYVGLWPANFPWPAPWRAVDGWPLRGKPSAVCQPTWPTKPVIFLGSINEQ